MVGSRGFHSTELSEKEEEDNFFFCFEELKERGILALIPCANAW